MKKNQLIKISLINSIVAAIYIAAVSLLMSNGEKLFGKTTNVLDGVAILLLFVISATIVGFLILGRPLLMYLDSLKKESIKLFTYTIGWLVIIATIIFIILIICRS